jgi:hypothetical protein
MKLLTVIFVIAMCAGTSVFGQVAPTASKDSAIVMDPADRKMLETISVKYMGGLFGFSKKEHGTIKFDTINERLLFIGKDGKERFSVPYSAFEVVYPSQKKVQSGIGRTVGAIPIPGAGLGGLFIKKKKNYLIINYRDRDVSASGTINFLVDTSVMLHNSVFTVGENAEMKSRGDSYVRRADF